MGETGWGSASQFQYKNYREKSSRTHIQNKGEESYMFALFLCAFLGSHFWPMPDRGHRVRETCGYSSRCHMPYKILFPVSFRKNPENQLGFWKRFDSLTHVKLVSYCFLPCFLWVSVKVFMYPLHLSKRHRQKRTANRLGTELLHVVTHYVYWRLLLPTSISRNGKYLSSGNS